MDASGYGRTVDNLDLSSPSASGVAFLGFTFNVDGTLSNNGLAQSKLTVNFGFDYDGGFAGQSVDGCSRSLSSGTESFNFTCTTRLYPILLYQQNTYWFSMSAQVIVAPSNMPVTGTGSASFFSTDTITSVQAYDANMNFIPNAIISSAGNGGTQFVDASAVPEPSTWFLLPSALSLIALQRRRHNKRVM